MDNFSNLSSTLDCSLTLSFRALCTRCRPSKFHVLISFHEREKGEKTNTSFQLHFSWKTQSLSSQLGSHFHSLTVQRASYIPRSRAFSGFRGSPAQLQRRRLLSHSSTPENNQTETNSYPYVPYYFIFQKNEQPHKSE